MTRTLVDGFGLFDSQLKFVTFLPEHCPGHLDRVGGGEIHMQHH
jgi:hypothetical protein